MPTNQPQPIDTLFQTYDRSLYKITGAFQDGSIPNMINSNNPNADQSSSTTIDPGDIGSGVMTATMQTGTGSQQQGKKLFTDTVEGYILGVDPTDGQAKFAIGNINTFFQWDGQTLTVQGNLVATSANIGGFEISPSGGLIGNTILLKSYPTDNQYPDTGSLYYGYLTGTPPAPQIFNYTFAIYNDQSTSSLNFASIGLVGPSFLFAGDIILGAPSILPSSSLPGNITLNAYTNINLNAPNLLFNGSSLGGPTNPSFTANASVAITSGYGVSVPDPSGNVFAGVTPIVLSDTKIDTNAINNLYPFGSDFDWLDSTHVVIVYNETASTFKNFAVIGTVNAITGAVTLGTPVQLNTSGSGFNLKVATLSSTLFVVAYNTTSTTARFVACTVSGNTITQGTDATKTIIQTPQGFGRILKVDSTHFVWGEVGPSNGGSTKAMLVPGSISGTTITLGTEVDTTLFSGSNFTITCILMCSLSTTQFAFVVGGFNGSTNAGHSEGIAFTVSSNAISAGSATIFNGGGANFEGMVVLKTLDATHVVGMTNFGGWCAVATVSSTTWTSGTAVDGSGGLGQNKVQQTPGAGFDLAVLSSTAFVTANRGANDDLIACACTISGTTITAGTGITVDSTVNSAGDGISASSLLQFANTNYVVISYQSTSNVNNLALISISGTTSTTVWKTINSFTSTVGYRSLKFISFSIGSTQIGLLGSNTSGGSLPYFDIVVVPTQLIAGVASGTVAAGGTATIITGGVPSVFTGLGAGVPYYIIPTTGAYTTNSSGNYKLGIAVNSTSIIMASNPAAGVAYQ